MKKIGISAALLVVLPLSIVPAGFAAVLRVDPSASGAGNGSSWADAHVDLQDALAQAASGDEIWVKAGTYVPGVTPDEWVTFQLRNGLALYGGFAGNETARDQRDPVANVTILSGDVGDDDVYGIPWYNMNLNTPNSAHVVTGSGTDNTAVLDGFMVEAGAYGPSGTPAGDPAMYGSGLYNINGSPTVRNCVFRRNLSAFAAGAAIYNQDSSPIITGCSFVQNYVHLGSGAGIFNYGTSQPVIEDCRFTENYARGGSGGGEAQGGAIASWQTPGLVVERCTFEYNRADFITGGGYDLPRGAAISYFGDGALTVRDCAFSHNAASAGGAIFCWSDALIVNSTFFANQAFKVVIGGQSAGGFGGAFVHQRFSEASVRLVNCTFSRNTAGEAAVYGLGVSPILVENSILFDNTANGEGLTPLQAQVKGSAEFDHSCVQGLFDLIPGEDPPDSTNLPGCTDFDPLLAAPASGDFHLTGGSPCIDTGSNALLPPGTTIDLDGAPRTAQGLPGAGQPIVDMGAYEFPAATSGVPDTPDRHEGPLRIMAVGPNPFRSTTTIRYELAETARVRIDVFDVAGRRVANLFEGETPAGEHVLSWSGRADDGGPAAPGIYWIRIRAGESNASGRVVLKP